MPLGIHKVLKRKTISSQSLKADFKGWGRLLMSFHMSTYQNIKKQ